MEELLNIMDNQHKIEDKQSAIDTTQRKQMIHLMNRFMNLDHK